MNKLDPEHLHLLLDEPIYVLNKHFDVTETQANDEKSDQKEFEKEAKEVKGVLIINEEIGEDIILQEDEEFLFKGLSALEINKDDVTIISTKTTAEDVKLIPHTKRIIFKSEAEESRLYRPTNSNGIVSMECNSLSQIRNDNELKKRFWLGLKAMFEN